MKKASHGFMSSITLLCLEFTVVACTVDIKMSSTGSIINQKDPVVLQTPVVLPAECNATITKLVVHVFNDMPIGGFLSPKNVPSRNDRPSALLLLPS